MGSIVSNGLKITSIQKAFPTIRENGAYPRMMKGECKIADEDQSQTR
jgi:hypothetical protein